MIIFDYTCIIAKQTLNTGKSAKDKPYFYEKAVVDLRTLRNDELNHLLLEAQSINAQIQQYLSERG